jgi:tRNA(adenine34) deaminase
VGDGSAGSNPSGRTIFGSARIQGNGGIDIGTLVAPHSAVYFPVLHLSVMIKTDEKFMAMAIKEARRAAENSEVPVGAVVVLGGEVIARAHNLREGLRDPSAHAEVLALRGAARKLDRWRLTGTTLYVTLEPCAMCAGALTLARIDRLVYGCDDPKAGACGSVFDIVRDPRLNHRIEVARGALEEDCRLVLKEFFEKRREENGALEK